MNMLEDQHKLSVFRCKLCKLRLDHPIMQVQQIGNICGSCYGRGVFTDAVPDLQLEEDLTKVIFPCKYQDRGCIFEASFLIVCYHERRCNFRNRVCPLAYESECGHKLIPDLIVHFEDCHRHRVLQFEDNEVVVNNPLETCDIFYLIRLKFKYFLLRIKLDNFRQLVLYAFYYFDHCNDPYTFNLHINSEYFTLTSISFNSLHESEIDYIFNENHGLKMDLSMLKINLTNAVTFIANYEHAPLKEELKSFECPICFYYMVDEIHTCARGHSVCHVCKKKMVKCPSCSSSFSGRNYSLETLSKVVKFPCKNSSLCNKYITGNDYKTHSLNCSYEIHKCPFAKTSDRCAWKGLYHALLVHLRTTHEGLVHENGDSITIPLNMDIKYVRCFILENHVAICSYELNHDGTISLDSSLLKHLDSRGLVCKILVGDQSNLNNCVLQFSLPFYSPKSICIRKYVTNSSLKLRIIFKRSIDVIDSE